jgi:hypothetical protein
VSTDGPETRPRIPDLLKKYDLHTKVLLGDEKQLREYGIRVASSLYLVDRNGLLAAVPSEFYFGLEKKVRARLPDLLEGKGQRGTLLWGVEKAPKGLGILWKQESNRALTALAVAPASKDHPAEIGVLEESHLTRYSASGELLADNSVEAPSAYGLIGADLDGDGKNEWIVKEESGFKVLDPGGQPYWEYWLSWPDWDFIGVMDLDGNGSQEILIRDGSSVVAKKSVPGVLWRTPPMGYLRSVVADGAGGMQVQTPEGIQELDLRGHPRGARRPFSGRALLAGRIRQGSGKSLDVFSARYGAKIDVKHDLDGDGLNDVLVYSHGGLAVYSQKGEPLLILKVYDNQTEVLATLANLDGRPGDELVIAIPHYGLVALGISPKATPLAVASSPSAPRSPSMN